jgi:hypothetical protein
MSNINDEDTNYRNDKNSKGKRKSLKSILTSYLTSKKIVPKDLKKDFHEVKQKMNLKKNSFEALNDLQKELITLSKNEKSKNDK